MSLVGFENHRASARRVRHMRKQAKTKHRVMTRKKSRAVKKCKGMSAERNESTDRGAFHGARFFLSWWMVGYLFLPGSLFFCCLGGCWYGGLVCPGPVSIEYGQGSHPKLLVVYRQTCGVFWFLTMYLWLYLSGNSAPVVT